ncbi:MAG: hypothetical protein GX612_09020 [Bacteroidales bacterium]|jgi:hypothetical protein|nr:hypothetical protein [Bacteroidales bacterium]
MGISKRKALQLTAILFTVVVVLALMVFLIKVYRYVQAPDKKAFDFIGPEVALIVKVDNFKAIKDLEQSEQNFLPFILLPENHNQLQSFIRFTEGLSFLYDIAEECPLSICFYPNEKSASMVFMVEVTKKYDREIQSLFTYLKKRHHAKSLAYKEDKVFQIHTGKNILYYVYTHGLLLFGFDQKTISMSLNQSKQPDKGISKELTDLSTTLSASRPFHLLIHHPVFHRYLTNKNEQLIENHLLQSMAFCEWSALDMTFMDQKLIFSGYTILNPLRKESFFYNNNKNTSINLHFFPLSTSRILAWQGDTYSRFSHLKSLNAGSQEDFFSMLKPNSMCFFQTQGDTASSFLMLKSDDTEEAAFHLFNCVGTEFVNNAYVYDTFYVNTSMVGGIDIPNFFLPFLPLTSDLKRLKAYTYIEPYFIFSDRNTLIAEFIMALKTEDRLSNDSVFTAFDAYFPNKANFVYYKKLNTSNATSVNFGHLQSKVKAYRLQINKHKKNIMFFSFVVDLNS